MTLTGNNYSLHKSLQRFASLLSLNVLSWLGIILAFLGFLDAIYLTVIHYKHIIPPCTISHGGCEVVLTSQFATIGSIPIALFGAAYYFTVFTAILSYKQSRYKWLITFSLWITGVGLLVSLFLVAIQIFVLHSFCQFCLGSEVVTFLLFDTLWWLWRKEGRVI